MFELQIFHLSFLHAICVSIFSHITQNSALSCGKFPSDKHIYTEIDIKLRNKIKELDIKCRFYKHGCLKIEKVDNIEKHESGCQFKKMICQHSNSNCSSEHHSFNCPHTLMVCPSCNKTLKLEEVFYPILFKKIKK